MSITPVVPNLVSSQQSYANKYDPQGQYQQGAPSLLAALNALPTPQGLPVRPATVQNAINPLALFDQARANRGLSPLTPAQSALALQTLRTGQPVTKPRRQSVLRNVIQDMRDIVGGIPQLPGALVNEVRSLPQVPGLIAPAIAQANGNPLAAVGNLAALPGVRMVPGAFTAQNLFGSTGEGIQGVLARPLFTALDLLPVAQGLARASRVGKAAEVAYTDQVNALTKAHVAEGYPAPTTILPRPPTALKSVLTQSLTPAGDLVPSKLGTALNFGKESFKASTPGNYLTQMFGERATSRISESLTAPMREFADPSIKSTSIRWTGKGGNEAISDLLVQRDQAMQIINQQAEVMGIKPMSPEAANLHYKMFNSFDDQGNPIAPELNPTYTPTERAVAYHLRDFQQTQAMLTDALPQPSSTGTIWVDGNPETYDYRRFARLSKLQAAESHAGEIQAVRASVLDPANNGMSLQELQDGLARTQGATGKNARLLEKLYQSAIDNYDRPTNMDALIPALRTIERVPGTPVKRLIDHLQNGRWPNALKDLKSLSEANYAKDLFVDLDGAKAELSRLAQRDRALSSTAHVTDRYVERLAKVRNRAESQRPPARFEPRTAEIATEKIKSRVQTVFSADPDLPNLIKMVEGGVYDVVIERAPEMEKLIRQEQVAANKSWKMLRDSGENPIFMARVTPEQAARQPYIRVSDKPMTPGAIKARMMDAAPFVKDVAIIVNQQVLDLLSQRANADLYSQLSTNYGRTRASLVAEYSQRLLNQDSQIPLKTRLHRMIETGWKEYKPGEFGGNPAAFAVSNGESIYIPRAMYDNLTRMYTPREPGLTALFDKPMNAFRMSVLPLALRWQVNNVVSNMIILAVEDARALRYLPDVMREMWRERKEIPVAELRMKSVGEPPAGYGSQPPDVMRWRAELTPDSPMKDLIGAVAQDASGKTVRSLYEAARSDRLAKIKDAGKKFVETSYGYNQLFDDMSRGAMSRAKMKSYLGKGYSEEAAQALTSSSIRRVFQAWDEMTPLERSVMRSIMPFYGWAAYAARYVLHYPFDHPLRVQVMNSLVNAEMTDNLTGLPDYIRRMVLLGDPRANGVVKALNVAPFNPFGGVPSMFTIQGFMGQTSPIITSVLESMGVNTMQGGPQLYPEMQYDPETGRLMAKPKSFTGNLLGNMIPQVQGISSLLGWNDRFNSTLARDPAAAGRMLLSNFGIPILYRNINIGDQLIKSEIARATDQETARKNALKTGDLSVLGDFPGLAAYGEQIRALDKAGQLDQYRPTAGQPGAPSGASGPAYAVQAALTG